MRGSIKKRYEGSWTIRVDMGYKINPETGLKKRNQKSFTLHGTKKQAEAKLAEILRDLNRGQLVEPSKVILGDWLDRWLEAAVKPPNRRPQTYSAYKAIIRNHLKPGLGTIPLQALKPTDIKRYYTDSQLSPATLQVHHAIIHSALRAAQLEDLVHRNVAELVTGKPRASDKTKDVLENCWEAGEAARFLTAAQKEGPQAAALYGLALDTGARKAEICALKWSDIDFVGQTVSIVRQLIRLDGKVTFGPPKNGVPRNLVISAETCALLRKHRSHQNEMKMANRIKYKDQGFVFAKEWQHTHQYADMLGEPLDMHGVGQDEFKRLTKVAGVRSIKFHGLRHSCATLMLQAGVPIKVVSDRLGHKTINITLNIYAHALPSMQQDAVQRLASVLYSSAPK